MAAINYLTQIEFDHGAVRTLPATLDALGIKRPLVITDKGVEAAGLLSAVLQFLPDRAGAEIFDATPQNPTETAVRKALTTWRATKRDGMVAVGGGSPIDLAKAVALLATHREPLEQYVAIRDGAKRITGSLVPVIAIPTTAGTGSEVGRAVLITFGEGKKQAIIHPKLIPSRVICDPDLTAGLPPKLTAGTGMDALTHCIETFLSPRINPPADAIALDGLARAWRWIEPAVEDGGNREARWQMMMAALQGGLTFQKGLGAVHALSHPLGGISGLMLHHGTLNAILLPAVLRFNKEHAEGKYDRLRTAMGLPKSADLAEKVRELNARIGIPKSLAALGFSESMVPGVVEGAILDHSNATNPRQCSREDFCSLLSEST